MWLADWASIIAVLGIGLLILGFALSSLLFVIIGAVVSLGCIFVIWKEYSTLNR